MSKGPQDGGYFGRMSSVIKPEYLTAIRVIHGSRDHD